VSRVAFLFVVPRKNICTIAFSTLRHRSPCGGLSRLAAPTFPPQKPCDCDPTPVDCRKIHGAWKRSLWLLALGATIPTECGRSSARSLPVAGLEKFGEIVANALTSVPSLSGTSFQKKKMKNPLPHFLRRGATHKNFENKLIFGGRGENLPGGVPHLVKDIFFRTPSLSSLCFKKKKNKKGSRSLASFLFLKRSERPKKDL
jgi:hypothetical protein